MRRLLVVDRYESAAFDDVARKAQPGDQWDVLLFGLSHEWFEWRHRARLPAGVQWRLIDPAEFSAEAMRRTAAFVVAAVGDLPKQDLGGETLGGLLGEDWWFLEISEKGPYRGPLVGQLYRLAMLRLVLEHHPYQQVVAEIEDALVAGVLRTFASSDPAWTFLTIPTAETGPALSNRPLIRYWAQAARAAAWLVAAWSVCRALPTVVPARGARLTFTAFPWWWFDIATPAARERFFSARGDESAGYLAWLSEPRTLKAHIGPVAETFQRERIVPLQRFLGWRDLIALFSILKFMRVVRFERRLRARVRAAFEGFEVGPLVARDVSQSLTSHEPFQDELVMRATRRAAAALAPAHVLYRAEFQPIEHALVRGLKSRGTLSLGFVHFPFGERYTAMRFSPAEALRPLPDGVLAIGPAAARHAIEGGFPAERVAVCGPQRYGRLQAALTAPEARTERRTRLGLQHDQFVVFVAIAIIDVDTEALAAALARCAAEHRDVHFVIRTHPNQPRTKLAVDTLLAELGAGRARLMPASGDLYDFIGAADAMVCIGSMIAFEAMALDVMPIVFENPSAYAATSLAEFEAGLFVAKNRAELVEAIGHVRVHSTLVREKRARWSVMLGDVLGDLNRPLGPQMHDAIRAIAKGAGQ